ncbi:ISL3 family transposase [Desulfosediminicola ganghwensis]|uniref:ISL3 family transposase n=1 Tax=Desulfosediminicola ganghwensis TaxID=2569540 RepID=UPI0010ACED73|nr:ISL3 family transposase [Desulfosediminicola ganghwensis]
MNTNDIMVLGLGLQAPWRLVDQHLDLEKKPHELQLEIAADRGSQYPCPQCQKMCSAHDFTEKKWRHLNFFQHHCYITARVPRVICPEHGVRLVKVPWAREGSGFTLLFEQAALTLVREMPVNAAARIIGITDKRLWRIVFHYVNKALSQFDFSEVRSIGLDETASKRGHNYVTTFIDMEKSSEPVLFVTSGKGKKTVQEFTTFLEAKGGKVDNIAEVVCDMSPAFLSAVKEHLPKSNVTIDWFHIVQKFVKSVDDTRKLEHRFINLPPGSRYAVLKGKNKRLTSKQVTALSTLLETKCETATAWQIKESLAWIRNAESIEQAEERINVFIEKATLLVKGNKYTASVLDALATLKKHANQVIQRWASTYTNARLEGLNSLFQAARNRARGYRNNETFIAMIYMIASPAGSILKSI